jgi:DNA topoisomerase-1
VQTVAVRLIVEREREIGAFGPVEYWTLDAHLHPEKQAEKSTQGALCGHRRRAGAGGQRPGQGRQRAVHRQCAARQKAMDEVVAALEKAKWSLVSVQSTEKQRKPLAPFITSQLQRDAASKLGFNVRRTMGVAQRLYEGVDVGAEGTVGLITYMRTDSPRVAPEAVAGAREWIGKQLGAGTCPPRPTCTRARRPRRTRTKPSGPPTFRGPRSRLRAT